MNLRNSPVIWLSAVFTLAFLSQMNTIQYWFVATDSLSLIETSRIQTIADLAMLFTQPLMDGTDFTNTALFYRPVSSLSYAFDYFLWGLSPRGFHLSNVILHAIAAVLVAITITEMTTQPAVGYITAGLFAVHPLTVGTVPAISRRQDILMTIFVLSALFLFIRSQHKDSPRLLSGALTMYAFALGTKETAVVVPGLAFAWLVIHQEEDNWWLTLKGAITSVIPFVAITGVYLLVRIAILGGLGGYRDIAASSPGISVVVVPMKYILWVTHPTFPFENILPTLSESVLISLLIVGVASSAAVIWHQQLCHRLRKVELLMLVTSGIAFGLVVGVSLFATPIQLLMPMGMTETNAIFRYLVGFLFISGCLAGIVSAGLVRAQQFNLPTRRMLVFFIVWLLSVPGLLLVTGAGIGSPLKIGDQIQTGYLCIIPAMAILSLILYSAVNQISQTHQSKGLRLDANAALIFFIVALLAPLLITSPLVYSYGEWEKAGEVNQQMLTELSSELNDIRTSTPIYILKPPTIKGVNSPLSSSVKPLKTYSVESWFRLQRPSYYREVGLVGEQEIKPSSTGMSPSIKMSVEAIFVRFNSSQYNGS